MASLVMLSTGCDEKKLPLVVSVPLPSDYSPLSGTSNYFYFMLTDSLLCITEYVPDNDSMGTIILSRIQLEDPHEVDTLIYLEKPFLDVYLTKKITPHGNKLSTSDWYSYCFIPPEPGYALYPLPLGDTSGMIHFGHVEASYCDTFSRQTLVSELHSQGQLFYLIDMHSSHPRTKAAFEGLVLDLHYPYLLLYSGFRYLEYGVMIHPDNMDLNIARFIVVDLRDLNSALDLPDEGGEGMLTPDGRFLYMEGEPVEDWDEEKLPAMYLHQIQEFDLETSVIEKKTIRIPSSSFGSHESHPFFGPDNQLLYAGERMGWGGWPDMPFQTPPVANFEDSVYEASWFRQLLKDERSWLDWQLSPWGRWLVLHFYNRSEAFFPQYSVITPSEALFDPNLMGQVDNLRRFPHGWLRKILYHASFEFLPEEEWVIIRHEPKTFISLLFQWLGIGSTPHLYHCEENSRPVNLGTFFEHFELLTSEIFFSPNGYYIGYVTKVAGKYKLQVRELPR